jgi:hypothetical protein
VCVQQWTCSYRLRLPARLRTYSTKEVIITKMADATNSPHNETPGSSPNNPQPTTSEKKAGSNRRNAEKSTGPRTEQGKANSRLNALKHGILASQGVITTIEGRAPRGEFEAMVDGLAEDFQPVGTYEQLLVQEIAACFWRKRRLLRFENRAAFESRDRRTFNLMKRVRENDLQPRYTIEGTKLEADDILDEAGLGLDLPNERDSMRVVRYEGSISRTLRNALAQLKARQKERLANRTGNGDNSSAYADRDVVADADAMKVNAGREHGRMGSKISLISHALDIERDKDLIAEEEAEAEEAISKAARENVAALLGKNYQTKPKSPADPGIQAAREQRPTGAKSSSQEDGSPHPGRPPSSK